MLCCFLYVKTNNTMNSQIELLRKSLEGMADSGSNSYHLFGFGDVEMTPTTGKYTKEAAKNILHKFPEEDSDHVKAYRSLVFLSRYLAENDFEDDYFVDQYTIEEQLGRVRHKIADDAHSDILSRLEIDSEDNWSDYQNTHIHDPVSKAHCQVSNAAKRDSMIEQRAEQTAHEILEAPL